MNTLKQELYKQCLDYVKTRMEAAELALADAKEASDEETKSSAGDKYETGRAMMEQEADRNMAQLTEANKLKVILNKINSTVLSDEAENGSVIFTDNGNFYIAIGAGTLTVNNESFFAISLASPLGAKLKGLKAGNDFALNGKHYHILRVI